MQSHNPRILVVDDEPALRELLLDALADFDVDVSAAASGSEAIAMARSAPVDFIVTDLCLGDSNGLDVLDQLRLHGGDIPAVVMTGQGDARAMSEASRRHPVELMVKPLDVERLRTTIRRELSRRDEGGRWQRRTQRLRQVARSINRDRKQAIEQLQTTCADLTEAYRNLCGQMKDQKTLLTYQQELLHARNDDDVFRLLFRTLVSHSGPLYGVAMACDAQAELHVVGRFGVPQPDGLRFGQALAKPLIDMILANPQCVLMDCTEETELFDESIRKRLVGVTVLAVPLIPAPGEMIGVVVLYRKGEQPFTDEDVALVDSLANPTAIAVERND